MCRFRVSILALFSALFCAQAIAHIPRGYDLRAIHFVHDGGDTHAYFRLTFPLVVAKGMGPQRPDGHLEPPPFTELRIEGTHGFYFVDPARIRAAPLELGRLLADGHRLERKGKVVVPSIVSVRVYPRGMVPPFNTLDEIRHATAPGEAYPSQATETDAAFAVVDAHLIYPGLAEEFRISSSLSNQVIGQPEIQNLMVDHRAGRDVIYRSSGPMHEAVLVNPSGLSAFASFVRHGAGHVLSGADHLLFVLCLSLGATGFAALAWRVTGFTLGHTVSLILGFWGYAPQAKWFVPTVESTIALSIALAGASLWYDSARLRGVLIIVIIVGFVHGLGFSVGLREILNVNGPQVWTSLAAFNIGVELGQILFACAVLLLFRAMVSARPMWRGAVLRMAAITCVLAGAYWLVERVQPLLV